MIGAIGFGPNHLRSANVNKTTKPTWNKPELVKLGTLKDVAGGTFSGNDSNGQGQGSSRNPVS